MISKKIALTGNIGSGKSTIAKIFKENHIPVFDADAIIKKIYDQSITFKDAIQAQYPELIDNDKVSKEKIIIKLNGNPEFLSKLEALLYPILDQERQNFIEDNQCSMLLVFEIPLLFEKNKQNEYDEIILIHAPYHIRKERVLKRPNMTTEKFDFMNDNQIDYKKVFNKATLSIDTAKPIDKVRDIIINRYFRN